MVAQNSNKQEFSKWRNLLWPIYDHELKKVVPLLFIFFFLAFNYNVLRSLKDTLVVATEKTGADVIPFIKVWVMFPASILLTFLFLRLSSRFSRETVFYTILSAFLIYFFFFSLVIYPNRQMLHLHESADWLQSILPNGWRGFVSIYRYWTLTSFYVAAELWGPFVLSILAWGFANQITHMDEAKRFYGLLGIGINLSAIAAGTFSVFISNFASTFTQYDRWSFSLNCLLTVVIFFGLISMALFRWMHKAALSEEIVAVEKEPCPQKKKKFSLRENLRFLTTSKYVIYLTSIIVCYNAIINLVEVFWKQEVYEFYQNSPDLSLSYNVFMNKMTTATGLIATLVAFAVSGNVIRKFGWTFSALITPVLLLVTSIGFFGFFFLKGHTSTITNLLGVTPLALVVFFGSLQNCLSRVARYTVFDATREMAYVPLSSDDKNKAKAAIDGVCNRLGKSTGSITYAGLLLWVPTIVETAPFLAPILFAFILLWIVSVRNLGRKLYVLSPSTEPSSSSQEQKIVSATT